MAAHEQHDQRVVLVGDLGAAAPAAASALPRPGATARCAAGRSAGARPSGSASRAGSPGCRRAASGSAAAISASWTASSAASKSPYRRTSAPRTCGASSRSRSSTPAGTFSARPRRLEVRLHLGDVGRRLVHDLAHLDRLLRSGRRPGPGTAESLRGDLERARLRLDVDDLVAGEPLLELLERPVGDDRRGAVGGHDLGQVRPGEDLGLRRARRCATSSLCSAR